MKDYQKPVVQIIKFTEDEEIMTSVPGMGGGASYGGGNFDGAEVE